jgi:hypothetical protein
MFCRYLLRFLLWRIGPLSTYAEQNGIPWEITELCVILLFLPSVLGPTCSFHESLHVQPRSTGDITRSIRILLLLCQTSLGISSLLTFPSPCLSAQYNPLLSLTPRSSEFNTASLNELWNNVTPPFRLLLVTYFRRNFAFRQPPSTNKKNKNNNKLRGP